MTTYRKRKGHDVWHWCTNCTNWPTSDYNEKTYAGVERPEFGKLCNQCRSKEKAEECS
jgi:hypothetical protein